MNNTPILSQASSDARAVMQAAQQRRKEAAEALIATAAATYPPGSVLEISLARTRIQVRVLYVHDTWWHRAGQIEVENVRTGKQRTIESTSESSQIEIISLPTDRLETGGVDPKA